MPLSAGSPVLLSPLPDARELPLDSAADGGGYDLLRRIGVAEGKPGTPVSAFNSSI